MKRLIPILVALLAWSWPALAQDDPDPRLIRAVRAARAAAGGGGKPADLYAARRLVRRFTALEEEA